jgi:transcriptional regulator with XRE-family HTH domain
MPETASDDDREARPPRRGREPLWRDVLGEQLRSLRHDRGETLAETAGRAGVSPQYLSEVERGVKEPSSEMIAAVAGALDTSLIDLTAGVAERLRTQRSVTASLSWASRAGAGLRAPAGQRATAGHRTTAGHRAAARRATAAHRPEPYARYRHYAAGHCRSSITWSTSPYSLAASAVKTRSWSVSKRSRPMSWPLCRARIRSMSARTRTTSSA